jgi:hypothetical protein
MGLVSSLTAFGVRIVLVYRCINVKCLGLFSIRFPVVVTLTLMFFFINMVV